MAIDTLAKRQAALLDINGMVTPDGAFDAADRQYLVGMYFESGSPPPGGSGGMEVIYHSPHHSDGAFAGRSIIRFGKVALSLYHALRSTRLLHFKERIDFLRFSVSHLDITPFLIRRFAWHR